MIKKLAASILFAFGLLVVVPSGADTMTNPKDSVASFDDRQCGEVLPMFNWVMRGFDERVVFTSDNGKLVVFYSPSGKTYTIMKIVKLKLDHVVVEKACIEESGHTYNFTLSVLSDFKS